MIIKDNQGNDYKIPNLKEFKDHILTFHTINGKADYSLHEENGRYFNVTPSFIENLFNS
tara:strand:+ start:4031 stop:4207 length:177 start_codon:yes stop_codon:yes gene_type:complete